MMHNNTNETNDVSVSQTQNWNLNKKIEQNDYIIIQQ